MAKKEEAMGNVLGSWAFLIGLILAVVVGVGFVQSDTWLMILILIGIIVGLLNITATETKAFLFSGAVLIIASSLGQNALSSVPIISEILDALLAIFVPATIIVAIKNVFSMARN